jgi:hypothetical protein
MWHEGVPGKTRIVTSTGVTATHGTVFELVQKVEVVGHKIFMDSYFTSPELFSNIHHRKINTCGTVHHNRKEMSPDFIPNICC